MIALNNEFLLVAKEDGGFIPCSVEQLTFELAGGAADQIDPEWLKQAAAGVLHYFKNELGQTHVTVAEFASALARVFQGLGLTAEVTTEPLAAGAKSKKSPAAAKTTGESPEAPAAPGNPAAKVWRADLRKIAVEAGKLGELEFQRRLRALLDEAISSSPEAVEFSGLRGCVKQITGRKIWCPECRRWEAWILDQIQTWFGERASGRRVALLVR
jgi:hypothetical protein